ncbi:MAG: ribosome silencing factor [Bacillota bacterium]|nr:ribosome silencing factor [Bacillota bacterium]
MVTKDVEALIRLIGRVAEEKKGQHIVALNVSELSSITDYHLIISAGNSIRARALADAIREATREEGLRPLRQEGYAEGRWILLDYGDVLIHIFLEEVRAHYDLERLWGDAPREALLP